LDNCTPCGFSEKFVKEGKETFPQINYEFIEEQLKKWSLSSNAASNKSSSTDESEERESVISAASTNVSFGNKLYLESKASNPNSISHKWSKIINIFVIADVIKEYCADYNAVSQPKASFDTYECIRLQQKKAVYDCMK
jgi:hypothetical protein